MIGSIIKIDYKTAIRFLLPRHYSGRKPTVTKAFGWYSCKLYSDENLKAVCTFRKPASPYVCQGICGKEYASQVYELNRLCRTDDWKEPLSQFVSACLRRLRPYNWIVVSYSDTAMNHHGYIYQACNFIYTGCNKERTDKYVSGGKHARHYKEEEQGQFRKFRSSKHRYIYFCTKDRRLKKKWKDCLKYKPMPYPKGNNNEDYELGCFLQEKLIPLSREEEK